VQAGQRTAWRGIAVKQNGQSFVVGAGREGAGALLRRLTCLTSRKIAKDTIRKSITLLAKRP
jgi:hypothetical protein